MPFPISINGSVRLRVTSPDTLIPRVTEEIDALLSGELAKAVDVDGSSVSFRAGMFRMVPGWNILAPIGSGRLIAEASESAIVVRYHLSLVQSLLFVTAATLLFAAPAVAAGQFVIYPIVMWLWLFGMNYVLTLFRFPNWLRTGLETRGPSGCH